jgi:hypothetical protein
MDRNHAETLSAFFDGEPVDAECLADSLAQPGAATLLSEFAAMRAHEQRDRSRPSQEFFDRMASRLRPSRMKRLLGSRIAVTALAASLLLAAGAGGFALAVARAVPVTLPLPPAASPGRWTLDRAPATPASIQRTAPTPGSSSARVPDPSGPPLPARRVRLDRWQDTSASVAVEGQR